MNTRQVIKTSIFLTLAVVLIVSHFFWDVTSYFKPEQIERWLAHAGGFAPFLYMAVMALAVIFSPIPSMPLDIAAGAFFGAFLGTVYSVTGAFIGANISFIIARHLGRNFIERFLGGHINFCTYCSDKILTKIVLLSRLLPIVSFDVVSYGAGLTKMSLKNFSLATVIGMIPLTFIYNYFGSVFVFGKGLTVILGLVMVVFFFIIPRWFERKNILYTQEHCTTKKPS
ncbi:MAG: TVP38/TMEM64 family protein [Thermodesulfovibrionia bacterium]|nr:TVP38/TMEM64 family protein [Thermodesulfovibrionia bacterium]